MNLKSTLSNIGSYAFGLVVMLALLAIPILFIMGGVWIGEKILPWLMLLSFFLLAFNIIILVPLALIPLTRQWAGIGFFISSYIFGLTGWFMGLLLTWILWGGIAVVIGLLIMGIGVVPIAMLATLFNGMWPDLGLLLLAVILTFGLRTLGLTLSENPHERRPRKLLFKRWFTSKEVKAVIGVLDEVSNIFDSAAFEMVKSNAERALLSDSKGITTALRQEGISPQQIVYALLSNIAGDHLETGQHHIYRGVLDPFIGEDLLLIFDYAVDQMRQIGVIDEEKASEQKATIRECIKQVG